MESFASALKSLKREFGNQYAVAHPKLMEILDLSQISIDDSKELRHFHLQIKSAVTCLGSMGYAFPLKLKLNENVTKAVIKLLRKLGSSFYKTFTAGNFDDQHIYLIKLAYFKVHSTCNAIATVIENCLKPNKYENAKARRKQRGFNSHDSEKSAKTGPCKKEKAKIFLLVL